MTKLDYDSFNELTFRKFSKLAKDSSLSCYQKIGFPDSYRQGKEDHIFRDIMHKLINLHKEKQLVMDIGPGCSGLPLKLIRLCRKKRHKLVLIDSKEMLDLLPDAACITKIPACYPALPERFFKQHAGSVNTILAYSMIHYVFVESNLFKFLDASLRLLADGGEMLIGDIPNISKRKRLFSSTSGIHAHQRFTSTREIPVVEFNTIESGKIDDAVIMSLLQRCRNSGFDAYLLPQADDLPMANRREDILIRKP